MYIINEDSYLAHYGVKGMKWGVRKQAERNARRKQLSKVNAKYGKKYTGDKSTISERSVADLSKYGSKKLGARLASNMGPELVLEAVRQAHAFYQAKSNGVPAKFNWQTAAVGATRAGLKTMANTAFKDSMAKRVAKKYNPDGSRKRGKQGDIGDIGLTTTIVAVGRTMAFARTLSRDSVTMAYAGVMGSMGN
jgi:hypothetical protein